MAGADAEEFARWCVERMRERGADRCFLLADTEREKIEAVLERSGIAVVQAESPPMETDVDRSGLDELKRFISDALALAECETVLTSLAESTITDPPRAFGREVVAFSGSREWSECWFHHHAGRSQAQLVQSEARGDKPRVLIADVFLTGRPQGGWKEGYELCRAFRNLGIACDVAGPDGLIPETRIPDIAAGYDLVIITENHPGASGWKWWDWHTVRTPKLFWAIDTHLVDYRPWLREAGIDIVAFSNPEEMDRYELAGSFFLPYAASARHHFAVDDPQPVRDAAFIGGMTPERQRLCEELGIQHLPANGAAYVHEMAATRICVNLSSARVLNARYLEIPASGAFMLTSPSPHFHRLLGGGEDVAAMFYHSQEELGAKIRHYLEHEDERAELAVAIRRRIRMHHCWENRAEEVLRRMGWLADAAPAADSGLRSGAIDLCSIPVCLIGGRSAAGEGARHRYAGNPRFEGLLFPHTTSVPPMPGGNAHGCSAAHLAAAGRALKEYPGQPVLLLEDDAVQSQWFEPVIREIPADADVVWLGRSVGFHRGRASPDLPAHSRERYRPLTGVCQGTHAVLLVTDGGKRVWMECCRSAVEGRMGAATDLVCSIEGAHRCRQYVAALPLFYQPDYKSTLYPLTP